MPDPAKKPFHEEFAEKIIGMLEQGTAPWQKPWTPAENLAPRNPATGTVYKGVNRLNLALAGYDDPRWMTLRQANDAGLTIKKGSRSTPIVYYQFTREQDKLDANGQPVKREDGQPEKETVRLDRPILRISRGFNGTQIEGMPPLDKKENAYEWNPHEKAEKILSASGATIKHDQADRNFYRASTDEIHLTPKSSFDAADKYYATALHELGHWTGHSMRMNREFGPFGSEKYAKEELRAEISSWMVGQDIGVGHDPGQHAAYVQSWIKVLRDDPMEIMRACRDAEHIRDYVLGLEMAKDQTLAQEAITFPETTLFVDSWGEDALFTSRAAAIAAWDHMFGNEARLELNQQDVDTESMTPEELFEAVHGDDEPFLTAELVEINTDGNAIYRCGDFFYDVPEFDAKGCSIIQLVELSEQEVVKEATQEKREADPALAKTWLHVPYKEKDEAKAHGAKWDGKQKQWYAPEGTDLTPLRRFLAPPEQQRQAPQECLDPRQEFARKLEDLGLDLKGKLPELDGKLHRVPLTGRSGLDGAYCLYADGRPAGWAQNFSTGEKVKLVATGVVLSSEERERQQREKAVRLQQAEQERTRARDAAAQRCRDMYAGFGPADKDNEYLQRKGIPALDGIKQDQGNLIIPLYNVDGEMRGFQAIAPDGTKAFAQGIEKGGNFHMIGADLSPKEIVICEGYATGVSLHEATDCTVAVAFDSGNLKRVAEKIRERHPNAAITICADNDHAAQRDGKPYNTGLEKAKEAALAVQGKVKVPLFNKSEQEKGYTDFNDLHKSRGLDAVKKQLDTREQNKGMER